MLFIARSEHREYGLDKKSVNLKQLIKNITDYFDCLIDEREMSLVIQVMDDLNIVANEIWIQRAIANLMSNAVLHGKEGGEITLEVKQNDADCVIKIVTHNVFIDEKHLSHLFDRFYQVDESRHKRTQTGGLGLEAAQAVFDGLDDVVAVERGHPGALGGFEPSVARAGNLRRHDDGVAVLGFHPAADDFLGAAHPLDVGRYGIAFCGVEEVDARFERHVENAVRGCFIGLTAEGHGAHANIGYVDCAFPEAAMLHVFLSQMSCGYARCARRRKMSARRKGQD